MNRVLIAASAVAFAATSAFAADMPQRAPAPVYKAAPAPIDYFSGWFVGGEIGYAWGRGKTDADSPLGPISYTYKTDSVIGGLNLGYRWRTSPNGYIGVATAIDITDLKDTLSPDPAGNLVSTTGKQTWLGTTGLQLGFTPTNNVLTYIGGGVAYGNAKATTTLGPGLGSLVLSTSDTRVGWYLGAGFDVAIGNNWSWGGEYKYVDLGKFKASWGSGLTAMSASSDVSDNIVMLNLKYRFAN
jgi:outer membrane immunogenic protein